MLNLYVTMQTWRASIKSLYPNNFQPINRLYCRAFLRRCTFELALASFLLTAVTFQTIPLFRKFALKIRLRCADGMCYSATSRSRRFDNGRLNPDQQIRRIGVINQLNTEKNDLGGVLATVNDRRQTPFSAISPKPHAQVSSSWHSISSSLPSVSSEPWPPDHHQVVFLVLCSRL